MITLIATYDSFTWNLWHYLAELGAEVETIRNDALSVAELRAKNPAGIVLSPGPGRPEDAGITVDIIRQLSGEIPIMGICLGHQAIAYAFGGTIKRIDPPIHGKLSYLIHQHQGLMAGLDNEIPVTRYHSLVVDEASLPGELMVTARTSAGEVMGLQHISHPTFGLQFHPESIASVGGYHMMARFLEQCGVPALSDDALASLAAKCLRLDEIFPEQLTR